MNILIFGAGAIGSIFGGLLSKKNNVMLIGRKSHVSEIKKSGLVIDGKTNLKVKLDAETSVNNISSLPDLVILTVKSYDTTSAIKQVSKILNENTTVLSLQNGLDNIDKIKKIVDSKKIIAGVTTQGAFFSGSGYVKHTGIGTTILGELKGDKTKRINNIVNAFNDVGINTFYSNNIIEEIWIKGIVNSSINPLTTFFQCKNGYLLINPILENLIEKICEESTIIANAQGVNLSYSKMIIKTKEVIRNTSENYSSMLQSYNKGKKTEIESINGKLIDIGKKQDIDTSLNEMLVYSVKFLTR